MKLIKFIALAALISHGSFALAEDMTAKQNEMFDMCDANKDGKISKSEYTDEKMKMFAKYDANSDGSLSKEEDSKMMMDMKEKMMDMDK